MKRAGSVVTFFVMLLIAACAVVPDIDKILLSSAQAGNAESQYQIGETYRNAYYNSLLGSFHLWEEAAAYYELAAKQGHPIAQYWLSVYYFTFFDDYASSFYWVQKAAIAGVAEAQGALGVHYAQGWGTEQNLIQAYKWIALGFDGGQWNPINKVADLDWLVKSTQMNIEQITEAKLLADEHIKIYGRSYSIVKAD